jgi:hypothetical protein
VQILKTARVGSALFHPFVVERVGLLSHGNAATRRRTYTEQDLKLHGVLAVLAALLPRRLWWSVMTWGGGDFA